MVCLIFEGSFPDPYIPCSSVPVVAARAQEASVFSVALPDGGGCFELSIIVLLELSIRSLIKSFNLSLR